MEPPVVVIDEALASFEIVWAAAGHAHAVFPTTYDELLLQTGAQSMEVGD
jgi:prolyl-tRNA editing enzyme YbaK/EbsC (Cys-tRNA(Pro) deacylase)